MAMGMLGPLTKRYERRRRERAGEGGGRLGPTTLTATTDAVARGGGGGGAGGFGSGAGVMSSFTRPTGSFNAPGPPKLPTGWAPGSAAAPEVAGSVQPAAGAGTGGLYGAPAAAHGCATTRGTEGSAEGRTMQLTVGSRTGREG